MEKKKEPKQFKLIRTNKTAIEKLRLLHRHSGIGDAHLDNLDQLINAAVSWEYRLSEQQLGQNAAR